MRVMTFVASIALAAPALAQVEVKQAEKPVQAELRPGDQEVPCPMQIDVPLGGSERKRPFIAMPVKQAWMNNEMQHHVCHTERIGDVDEEEGKKGKAHAGDCHKGPE